MRVRFPPIERVILFGGAPLLVATVAALKKRGVDVRVYTSPRHVAEKVDATGATLGDRLQALAQPFTSTEDINREAALIDEVTPTTLGLGMGEAWSFDKKLIERFGGRLLDFMGIPHPRYRGGAHYTWMILRNERQMGMNLQVINEDMVQGEHDSGAMLKSASWTLPAAARTPQDIFDAAVPHETAFIAEFLDDVRAGKELTATPPDESKSLFLPRLHTPTHGHVDWAWSGEDVERFICAFDDPYPGARTTIGGRAVAVKGARILDDESPFHPFQSGLVTRVNAGGGAVMVATTAGHLAIDRVIALDDGAIINATVRPGDRFITPPDAVAGALGARATYTASAAPSAPRRAIAVEDRFHGARVTLRLVTLADCTARYVEWLKEPAVNRFLETRFNSQTLESVTSFVRGMLADEASYLFAIVDKLDGMHVGNIKIGPINANHSFADVSYFIGERDRWGRGLASDAIRTATRIAFERLGLHRVQAGLYEKNVGSSKALLRAGYLHEGTFKAQLRGADGWEDHLWYGVVRDQWRDGSET